MTAPPKKPGPDLAPRVPDADAPATRPIHPWHAPDPRADRTCGRPRPRAAAPARAQRVPRSSRSLRPSRASTQYRVA